jgi:integrase
MEVTRQLRLDALNKHGLAPIQLTLCWAGHRLRLGSGQRCLPKHWDERRQHVKDKADSYASSVNQVLDDYSSVAAAAERAATETGQVLAPAVMRAEVERRYAELVAERAGRAELPPPPVAAPLTFFDHFDRWIEKEKQKISVRTGRKLSRDTLWTHQAVRDEIKDFGAATKLVVTFEGLNQEFYDGLRDYMLGTRGRSPRTFNTYIKRLRSFLFWAENQGLPVPARISKVLRLAQSYVGVEALTQAELLRIAAIDFTLPTVQAYLASSFPEPPPKAAGRGGRNALTSADHAQRTQWTRDLFLLCAYTSLRHADAQELGWQHVFPEQELIKKLLNKTNITALIPYLDDDVFQPVALLDSYRRLGEGATCLPFVRDPWRYLPHVAALARITRLKLGLHVGRKTYATLKVYQGIPKALVMLATGHQTEAQFNEYLGINEEELIASHRQTARRLPQKAQGL